jgi:tRNA-splicing ligase RtcB
MKRSWINKEEFAALGINDAKLQTKFQQVCNGLLKKNDLSKGELLSKLAEVVDHPLIFAEEKGSKFRYLAELLLAKKRQEALPQTDSKTYDLRAEKPDFPIYGAEHIDEKAIDQMNVAMRLPISLAGALMPDAHSGYGLPIGGVLATDSNTIIPYAVGVDIACRMCLSIYDISERAFDKDASRLKSILNENTVFGMGAKSKNYYDTSIFDRHEWSATKLIRSLKEKAYAQLGTSGTGNHFVEWGTFSIEDGMLADLPAGNYLALLSHSGSRGFGASIANYYSKLAMEKTVLPREARELAWLDLSSAEGQEYWISMNLAGDYASANHHEIHNKISTKLQAQPIVRIENHHNFAWKEKLSDGREVLVHRKGATPAGEDVLGIIPGSMATPGFLVRGKGNPAAIDSASHGAGRLMSRNRAFKEINKEAVQELLQARGISLLGSGLDEAPMVYKDIHAVMKAQDSLVEVLGKFMPKIVKMADPRERPED